MGEASRESDENGRKRGRKEGEEALAAHLPEEILRDILVRLPVKSLVRFKGVCKSWRAIISHPHFPKAHLGNINNVIYSRSMWCAISSSLPPVGARRLVYGSSKGLLFVFSDSEASLWNPCTGNYLIIPETLRILNEYVNTTPTKGSFCAGFGYDSSVDQIKAVLAIRNPEFDPKLHLFLYTSEIGSWTGINYPHDFPYFLQTPTDVVTLNDRLPHWKVRHEDGRLVIIYFDWMEERFKEVPLPDQLLINDDFRALDLADFGGCICAIDRRSRSRIEVWVMKDHGVEYSWTKLFTIPFSDPLDFLIPLELSRNHEVVMLHNCQDLVSHDLMTGDEDYICSIGTHHRLKLHTFMAALNSPNGALGIWKLKQCIKVPKWLENNQLIPRTPQSGKDPAKQGYGSSSMPIISDGDFWCHKIAKLVVADDYPPPHMVEHPDFVAVLQSLQPFFGSMIFNTVQGVHVPSYLREKRSLQKAIEGIPGRICLTLDWWHCSQTVGYVFLTGHYVDSYWMKRRRLLNVVMGPFPDSDYAFSCIVSDCLSKWSLEGRLFSLTVSQPLKESNSENLRALLCIKNPQILRGQLLILNCIARTLSSMAKDVLVRGRETIKSIWDSVKYLKISGPTEQRFLQLKQQLQVPSDNSQTQLNTTYQKLMAASELKELFSCLDTSDPYYMQGPSMEDWKRVESLSSVLRFLFDIASTFSSTTNPTANIFSREILFLQMRLARGAKSLDHFICNLMKPMQEKFDKYWKDCYLILGIAVVMDPRYKMKFIEYSFSKVYGESGALHIKLIREGIHELLEEYVARSLHVTLTDADRNVGSVKTEESHGANILSEPANSMEITRMELDEYLGEPLCPREGELDVLSWWKLHRVKHPTLSKLACDILSISICTVPPDWVFDSVSKESIFTGAS